LTISQKESTAQELEEKLKSELDNRVAAEQKAREEEIRKLSQAAEAEAEA